MYAKNIKIAQYLVSNFNNIDFTQIYASGVQSLDITQYFLNNGAFYNSNHMGYAGDIENGRLEILQFWSKMSDKCLAYCVDYIGIAVTHNQLEIVKWLVRNGANMARAMKAINKITSCDIVSFLINNGMDIHSKLDSYNNLLEYMAVIGRLDIIKLLVFHGASLEKNKERILYFSAKYDHIDILEYIVSMCTFEQKLYDLALGITFGSVHNSIPSGSNNPSIAKILVEKGATPSVSMLDSASRNGYYEMVKYIMSLGIKADDSAIYYAIKHTKISTAVYLVENTTEVYPYLIREAARTANLRLLKLFVEKGYDVNVAIQHKFGCDQYIDTVKYFVNNGANPDIAIANAAKQNLFDIVKFLISKGACVNKAIYSAANKNRVNIVHYLLQSGGDINVATRGAVYYDFCGMQTDYAYEMVSKNNYKVLVYLIEHGCDLKIITVDILSNVFIMCVANRKFIAAYRISYYITSRQLTPPKKDLYHRCAQILHRNIDKANKYMQNLYHAATNKKNKFQDIDIVCTS